MTIKTVITTEPPATLPVGGYQNQLTPSTPIPPLPGEQDPYPEQTCPGGKAKLTL